MAIKARSWVGFRSGVSLPLLFCGISSLAPVTDCDFCHTLPNVCGCISHSRQPATHRKNVVAAPNLRAELPSPQRRRDRNWFDPLPCSLHQIHEFGGAAYITSWGKFWLSVLGVYEWEVRFYHQCYCSLLLMFS